MGHLATLWLFLVAFLFIGCGANIPIGLSDQPSNIAIGKKLEGTLITTDKTEFNLSEDLGKDVLVLIFAQDTCTTCAAEAEEIAVKLRSLGRLPENVEIVTFLVGLTGEFALPDALDWKTDRDAQWKVGVQKGNENLFQNYFPGSSTVPALLIQKDGKIFFQHSGALGIEKLIEQTGEWQ